MFYAMKKSYWDETHKSDVWIPGHARVCDDGVYLVEVARAIPVWVLFLELDF